MRALVLPARLDHPSLADLGRSFVEAQTAASFLGAVRHNKRLSRRALRKAEELRCHASELDRPLDSLARAAIAPAA